MAPDSCKAGHGLHPNSAQTELEYSVQENAVNVKTFEPGVISLPKANYEALINKFHLPLRTIETDSVVGPFLWWTVHETPDDDFLRR